MITGIEHVAINTTNLDALKEWYTVRFGLRVVYEDGSICFLRAPDGGMIELLRVESKDEQVGDKVTGFNHIALSTDHFEETVEQLKAAGVPVVRGPQANPRGKVFFFRDPDGNVIQLIQRFRPLA